MFVVEKTEHFDKWLRRLKDLTAKSKILFRIQKLQNDEHFGDCKSVGYGIHELKINYSKGYRVYFAIRGIKVIILLLGGDEDTQQRDIEKAREILEQIKQ